MSQSHTTEYSATARILHWLIAIMIISQLAGGWYMTHLDLPSEQAFTIYQLHKSFGFVVLLLSVARLVWRLGHPPPALPVTMPGWQQRIAGLTHWVFYGLMIGIPLAGWVLVSASPIQIPTKLFFLLPVPHLPVPVSGVVAGIAAEVHEYLAFATAGLLILHIGAALKHHLKDRDDVLLRMAPKSHRPIWQVGRVVIASYLALAFSAFLLGFLFMQGEHDDTAPSGVSDVVADEIQNTAFSWVVDTNASRVEFAGSAYGTTHTLVIEAFDAAIDLNPKDPGGVGQIDVTLSMTSLAGSDVASTLSGADWFNSAAFSVATYKSTSIARSGDGAFQADGVLTIRDIEQPLIIPFVLSENADGSFTATSEFSLSRTAFGLGGPDTSIADEVAVTLSIIAQPPLGLVFEQ